VLKNWLMVDSSAKSLKITSLMISPLILFGATAWALFDFDNINLAYLITMGSSMIWQLCPVMVSSFYTDRITAYPLVAGIFVGFVISVIFAQERKDENASGLVLELSGWFGVLANFFTVFFVQVVFNCIGKPWMLNDDDRDFDKLHPIVLKQYGSKRLTAKMVNEVYLKGVVVPYGSTQNKVIGVGVVIATIAACPWYGKPYTAQDIYAGFPAWAFWQFVTYGCCCALQIWLVYSWKPSKAEVDDDKKELFDADDKGIMMLEKGSPEPGSEPPATPPPATKSEKGMNRKVSSNKVVPVDADNAAAVRGKCGKCGENVLATQPRTQVDGVYSHDTCP